MHDSSNFIERPCFSTFCTMNGPIMLTSMKKHFHQVFHWMVGSSLNYWYMLTNHLFIRKVSWSINIILLYKFRFYSVNQLQFKKNVLETGLKNVKHITWMYTSYYSLAYYLVVEQEWRETVDISCSILFLFIVSLAHLVFMSNALIIFLFLPLKTPIQVAHLEVIQMPKLFHKTAG
jgi:hypothetical protein